MDIEGLVDERKNELVELRRDFHKHAEAGWLEYYTVTSIIEYLKGCGVEVQFGKTVLKEESRTGLPSQKEFAEAYKKALALGIDINLLQDIKEGFTGVVGTIETGKEGPVTAFRFDMDAVSGSEIHSLQHRPFKDGFSSSNSKAVHSCGHDGHIAMGLVLAKCLKALNDEGRLIGKVKFIFQPAEEGARGARAMVDAGVLDGVDYLLSGHIGFKATKTGEVICGTNGFLDTKKIDVRLKGRAAHAGASPELGQNALLAAATIALGAHSLAQHGDGIARVNVGVLKSGTSRNIIPDEAFLQLEIRGETENITNDLDKRLESVIAGASSMYGVEHKVKIAGEARSACSDSELSELVEKAAQGMSSIDTIIPKGVLGASEDVTLMMDKVQRQGGKACYIMLGSHLAADHHQNNFDFDEGVLPIGVSLYLNILRKAGVLSED